MGLFDWLSTSSQSQDSVSGIRVAPETALERQVTPQLGQTFGQLTGLAEAGAGQADVTAGAQGQRDLASLLGRFSGATGLLQAQQAAIPGYEQLGEQIFGGQIRKQQAEASRLAGRMGRPTTDPVLQNMLARQRSESVGSFAAQQALNAPFQQTQFAAQRANVLQQLSLQAFNNRQAILNLGSQLREQDRGYRINTGQRYGNTTQTSTASPLNTIGALSAMAGSVIGGFSGMGGGAGGGGGGGAGMGGTGQVRSAY